MDPVTDDDSFGQSMLIVQNELHPAEIQNGLFDLMRDGVTAIRICSAYMSLSGSQILFNAMERAAANNDPKGIAKIIVSSFDFGLTEPDALRFWKRKTNCRVLVAGTSLLAGKTLVPQTAFHTKFYLFDRPDGTTGSLIGSANLTNRGLTINSEVAWLQKTHKDRYALNLAWENVTLPTKPLTDDILDAYSALYNRVTVSHPTEEFEPLPAPPIGSPSRYTPFADAISHPDRYDQMWIQSRGLQGGARTQLELPRGAHRFFGANYSDYDFQRVDHIAKPVLVAGCRWWTDRPLTWHGDNAMERINLPSLTMGGFDYENSLIIFRRIADNTFELRVYPWSSDSARAYIEASRRLDLVFRIGRNSNRIGGMI